MLQRLPRSTAMEGNNEQKLKTLRRPELKTKKATLTKKTSCLLDICTICKDPIIHTTLKKKKKRKKYCITHRHIKETN